MGLRRQRIVLAGDWPTRHGTGVRENIHVLELAEGNLAAIQHLMEK